MQSVYPKCAQLRSDQTAQMYRLILILAEHLKKRCILVFPKGSGLTARMRRLI